jgi:hypothetical protein
MSDYRRWRAEGGTFFFTVVTHQRQRFLRHLHIPSFVTESKGRFLQRLDATTNDLKDKLPCQSWGAARKFLNIFLREALYNRFLSEHYSLRVLERFLGVPLDRFVAVELRGERGGASLPRWRTIIGLEPPESAKYQAFARQVARKKKCARIHLDLWYWRRDELTK